MSSAQVRRHARLMVTGFIVLIAAGLINFLCFAQEPVPQTPKSQEKQAQTPKSETPDTAPTTDEEPRMVDGAYVLGGKVPNGMTAPKLIRYVDPKYTSKARHRRVQGICLVELVVDKNGIPRNAHVKQPLDPGLDKNAVNAIQQYRFQPATYHGQPAPVLVVIEVRFEVH